MEELTKDNEINQQKKEIKTTFFSLFNDLWKFTKNVLDLRNGIDKEHTIEGISSDVEFKGHAAWILVCSILIACIGLSDNNIPIIVGAMLISPLMGPILGIGLAAGTNDFDLLKKSLINYGIAFFISLIISTAYFLLVPVPEATFELIGRKQATILAIAIAFFGGSAGIIAGSRSSKSNVVPGVAIATALMPPLCTVGYGLATQQWDFFLGALYLFFINSVFIAIPTYLYIKYMRFPVKEFLDPKTEKRIRRLITFFLLIIAIPSGYFFYTVLTNSFYDSNVKQYVSYLDNELDKQNCNLVYHKVLESDSAKVIKIGIMGKTIEEEQINEWYKAINNFNLDNTELQIVQNEDFSQVLNEYKTKNSDETNLKIQEIIAANEYEINKIKQQIAARSKNSSNWNKAEKELQILFPEINTLGYANLIQSQKEGIHDTIPTLFIQWSNTAIKDSIDSYDNKIQSWIITRLELDTLNLNSSTNY